MEKRNHRNNKLKSLLTEHSIAEADLLREINKGLKEEDILYTSQSTLASYTCWDGKGKNVPKPGRAQRICRVLKRRWDIDINPRELFPEMQPTAQELKKLGAK